MRNMAVMGGLVAAGVASTAAMPQSAPVVLATVGGLIVGCWSIGDRLQDMMRDDARKRLDTEIAAHDETREELRRANRRIKELEKELGRPGGDDSEGRKQGGS
jgi:hypothetical protein